MKLARRELLRLAAGSVAAPVVPRAASGQPQVVLKLHHSLSPISNVHGRLLQPWARKVEADSGNRIRIEIFAAMQLGGAPAELYDQARDGVTDIVWAQPGATPGRFPSIEVFELPFIAGRRAASNARAVQEFAEAHLRKEFADVHPICFAAHDHALMHTGGSVRSMHDLKGLRLLAPTRLASEALNALGAASRVLSTAQLPEALAQKALDGCLLPWEAAPAARTHDLIRHHLEIQGAPTLCTTTFILAMNKGKYAALAADLKRVLDQNTGEAAAAAAGQMWDDQARLVEDTVRRRGNSINELRAEEAARWRKATEPVREAWIRRSKERGIDGGKLIETAQALVAKQGKP